MIIKKTRILFFIEVIIGSIGAYGQAYLLHHELVHTYPYKMMDAELYETIASFGIYLAPLVAIISGILFSRKRFWLITIAPVFLCPLLFFAVFKTFSIIQSESVSFSFDGKTPAIAAQEFSSYTICLAFVGLLIGGICSFILYRLSIEKGLSLKYILTNSLSI